MHVLPPDESIVESDLHESLHIEQFPLGSLPFVVDLVVFSSDALKHCAHQFHLIVLLFD